MRVEEEKKKENEDEKQHKERINKKKEDIMIQNIDNLNSYLKTLMEEIRTKNTQVKELGAL